jgi:predicted N-acetyltransferase YhbS
VNINIKEYNYQVPPINDVRAVMVKCKWWDVSDSEFETIFKSSALTLVAYDGDKPIATARVISDNVVYALIVDVLVLPELRGKGIGSKLIEQIFSFSKKADLKMIKLLSTPEGKSLYDKFGFKTRSLDEPGMIKFVYEID